MFTAPLTFPLDYLYPNETSNHPASVTRLMHRLMEISDKPLSDDSRAFLLDCTKDMIANSTSYRASPQTAYLSFLTRHIPANKEQSDLLEIFSSLYLSQRRINEHIPASQAFQYADPSLSQDTIDTITTLSKETDSLAIMLSRAPEIEQHIEKLEGCQESDRDTILTEIDYQRSVLKSVAQAKATLADAFERLNTEYTREKKELFEAYKAQLQAAVDTQRIALAAETEAEVDGEEEAEGEASDQDALQDVAEAPDTMHSAEEHEEEC